jgi:hypothetical protein
MASVSEAFASTSQGLQMAPAGVMFESPVVGQPPLVHETSGNENVFNSVVTDIALHVNASTKERILSGEFVVLICLLEKDSSAQSKFLKVVNGVHILSDSSRSIKHTVFVNLTKE